MPADLPTDRHTRDRGWRRSRRLPVIVCAFLWLVIAGLAIIAILRLTAWDHFQWFAVLNSVTLFVYAPAWLVLLVAAIGRRPLLAAAALVVVLIQIALVVPELTAAQPVPAWAAGAPTLRILDANVYSGNPSMAGYAGEISALRPQLVTLEEANPVDVAQLERSSALGRLPYRFQVGRYDPFAFFVASRYPLSGTRIVWLYRRPLIVQVTLELPMGPVPVWVVHTTAPLSVSFSEWRGQLALVDRLLRSRHPADLLVVGDFNATWGNQGFRSILDTGMTDAAAARGRALDMTWSQMMTPLPPLVRIDHVLTGPGLAVTQIRTATGPGSDHRDLVATLAIRR
jgi:endonuclease/exonuclease/phosphatase (EEP) superfamily protein YafD